MISGPPSGIENVLSGMRNFIENMVISKKTLLTYRGNCNICRNYYLKVSRTMHIIELRFCRHSRLLFSLLFVTIEI